VLSGGTISVEPETVCLGETITFTASGVVDSGGVKAINCTKEPIPPVSPTYKWTLTIPPDYPPPLPPLSGSGSSVGVVAEVPRTYTVTFVVMACLDQPLQLVLEPGVIGRVPLVVPVIAPADLSGHCVQIPAGPHTRP
jgi:hypothetical protein